MLHRLERQHVLSHRVEGREYFYRPTVSREAVRAPPLGGLKERLFGGDVTAMVSFAMSQSDVDRGDLARLRALINRHAGAAKR